MAVRRAIADGVRLVRDEAALVVQQRRRPRVVQRNGVRIEVTEPWATPFMREVIYSGSYEEYELALLRATVEPSDTYLEIGAGIGVLAAAACAIVGERNVTAVEANPQVARVAKRT